MNNLSFLRGSYIQNLFNEVMVEKNVACPTCRGEQIFFEDFGASWEDLQGLSWLFCENCSTKTMDEIQQKIISCA